MYYISPANFSLVTTAVVLCLVQWSYMMMASVSITRTQTATWAPKTFACVYSTKGGKLYGSSRDCNEGQTDLCTKTDPCTPCDATYLHLNRNGVRSRQEDCTICTPAFTGDCGFIPEVGPYCNLTTGVGPCTLCCKIVK